MPCERCKKKCGVPIECLYCKGHFCPRCTHLERHNCQGVNIKKLKDLDILREMTAFEKTPKHLKI